MRRLGLLGGTFDPVHQGHLDAAVLARDALGLDAVRFVPSRTPPHRQASPQASAFHRFAMVALAVAEHDGLLASDEELLESGPSYTWNTLTRLHGRGFAPTELFFLLGTDAFNEIAGWYRYPEVLDAAHFVVITRPGAALAAATTRIPEVGARLVAPEAVAGRDAAAAARIVLLAGTTAAVSSTEIRRRGRSGAPLTGLVPPAVMTHIQRHGLYR